MGSSSSTGQNNLELYLNDVYKKECVFQTSDEEVNFIQVGIESLVQTIVDSTLKNEYVEKRLKNCIDCLEGQGVTESQCPTNVTGVGSFYEKTKNGFPDEFDFIVPLGMSSNVEKAFHLENIVESMVDYIFQKSREDFNSITNGTSKLYFLSADHMKGPAICLLFQYENGFGEGRTIRVDLVPAYKLSTLSCIQDVQDVCALEPFCEEILSTGSYLRVYSERVTLTETELNFMRNVLSKDHLKAFRILKYLINGHGDGEKLQEHLDLHKKHYSSYKIKTMMIYHHYRCTNPDTADTGPCVLQVLNDIWKSGDNDTFPSIVRIRKPFEDQYKLCLKNYIAALAEVLQKMKKPTDRYDYEKCKIRRSVSKQYADDRNIKLTSSRLDECAQTLVKHL